MDSFIDTVDYIGIRVIQFCIKYMKREKLYRNRIEIAE